MFLKPKKGNLVAQFVVLLVIAAILIFVVSSFGAKIWQAFFPSADKSTMKSFDAVFNMINTKGVSLQDYDSTNMNIYLKDGYKIIFFDDGKLECRNQHWGMPIMATYYAPKECTSGEQCICLYKKVPAVAPETDTKEREKNLVRCYSFQNRINIDTTYFDLNRIVCNAKDIDPYGSYIFIKRQVYPENKGYIYVLESNDTNNALDANWSIPVCKTSDLSNPCYGKRNEDVIEATDQASFDKIYSYCSNSQNNNGVSYKSLGVLCEYPQGGTDCKTDCRQDDVASLCGTTYSKCEDYNNLQGHMRDSTSRDDFFTATYINEDDFKNYIMCNNDRSFCNVGNSLGCNIVTLDVYASHNYISGGCKNTAKGDAVVNDCLPSASTAADLEGVDCKIEFLKDSSGDIIESNNFVTFITSYNTNNIKCKAYINTYFYDKQSIMTCKDSKTDECKIFIESKDNCQLRFIADGQNYWLTHYDSSNPDCSTKVKALFTTFSTCETPKP